MEKSKQLTAKQKIIISMERLLRINNLDEIFVSDIIREARVARKTFYRSFQDKYDLIRCYFEEYYQKVFEEIISGQDWEEALLRYLTICEEKAVVLAHAYNSKDANGLQRTDVEMTINTYKKYLKQKGADVDAPDMEFAIKIASAGGTAMIIDWLLNGRKMEKIELVLHIKETLPNQILEYLLK